MDKRTTKKLHISLEEKIKRLQAELDAAKRAESAEANAKSLSDQLEDSFKTIFTMTDHWTKCYGIVINHNNELRSTNKALLAWAQAAYTRLQSLMALGVSLTPDAVTAKLLADAPDGVKGDGL